jgi:2-polyprenyl-6-hydroxyphenyl methylase/3-demethylubiquinone-9 3-methyltransferase
MRSIPAIEVPPNFMTIRAMLAGTSCATTRRVDERVALIERQGVQSKESPAVSTVTTSATVSAGTTNPSEAAFFGGLAADWWNPKGSSAMLHRINPLRLAYIRDAAVLRWGLNPRARSVLAGRRALDVGCGAGLVTEPLARMGASVTGIDAAPENVAVATLHAGRLAIDYRCISVEALAAEGARFELITCLEVVEHVADRAAFLAALRALLSDDGLLVMSTPNRTPLSYATLIVGAERVLGSIPRGAHDWSKFVQPVELATELALARFEVSDTSGMTWRPGTGFVLGRDASVTYFVTALPV